MAENNTIDALKNVFSESILHHEINAGDQCVVFVNPSQNTEILSWLREEPTQSYDLLVDVTAVDFGEGLPLQVVYQLWSLAHKNSLRIKCELEIENLTIKTVTSIWKSACLLYTSDAADE